MPQRNQIQKCGGNTQDGSPCDNGHGCTIQHKGKRGTSTTPATAHDEIAPPMDHAVKSIEPSTSVPATATVELIKLSEEQLGELAVVHATYETASVRLWGKNEQQVLLADTAAQAADLWRERQGEYRQLDYPDGKTVVEQLRQATNDSERQLVENWVASTLELLRVVATIHQYRYNDAVNDHHEIAAVVRQQFVPCLSERR